MHILPSPEARARALGTGDGKASLFLNSCFGFEILEQPSSKAHVTDNSTNRIFPTRMSLENWIEIQIRLEHKVAPRIIGEKRLTQAQKRRHSSKQKSFKKRTS